MIYVKNFAATINGKSCEKGDSIPANVQGRNWAPLFFDEKAEIERPGGALYIQNLDGDKDADGKVQTYFPSSRGYKTARYTLAFYIDKKDRKLQKHGSLQAEPTIQHSPMT